MSKYFFSVDWGTTSFRLRLADAADGCVLAEEKSNEGIAAIYERWQRSGKHETGRAGFYLAVVSRYIGDTEKNLKMALKGVPVVISGMASSSIGLIELPYAQTPFNIDGSGLKTTLIPADHTFSHDVLLISGARTADDVVRGEETQLVGTVGPGVTIKNELFIFPGTHSKHIVVKNNQVTGIKTYITGELFALLSQQSILKNSVKGGEFDDGAFKKGVADAQSLNLLHSAFKVRTNDLFGTYSHSENYNYLSGLLIGNELKDVYSSDAETISLVCGNELEIYYRTALQQLAPGRNIHLFSKQRAEETVVGGQLKIARQSTFLA